MLMKIPQSGVRELGARVYLADSRESSQNLSLPAAKVKPNLPQAPLRCTFLPVVLRSVSSSNARLSNVMYCSAYHHPC